MISKIVPILFVLLLYGCSNSSGSSDYGDYYYSEESGFEDGTYCADVEYYNPNTGTNSTYTLNVEVESNELVVIHWPSGGWLDDDHFYPEELDSDGYCYFTSDKGYEYEVTITGSPCSFTDKGRMADDVEEDYEDMHCPKCGDEKDSEYDDYCYWCQRKIDDEEENTCPSCGAYEIGLYGDECDDCKGEDEDDW